MKKNINKDRDFKYNIIFTGGGSGGHVIPALTIIDDLKGKFNIIYIGSHNGIERELVTKKKIRYYTISTGKLRRYLSFQNIIDMFKVFLGIIQAFFIIIRFKKSNTLLFSTGGFISVPVVIAGWLTGKKIFIHEQTSRVGLANKISSIFAEKIFISFDASKNFFPKEKTYLSGYPVKSECMRSYTNDRVIIDNINLKEIERERPIIFITGGGNGSLLINNIIRDLLDDLLNEGFFIIHQVGNNFYDEFIKIKKHNYIPLGFIQDEMVDLYKLATVIVSRSGAGTVSELLALGKRSLFIPLKIAQKNEQFHNAVQAKEELKSIIIEEDDLDSIILLEKILELKDSKLKSDSSKYSFNDGREYLVNEILNFF